MNYPYKDLVPLMSLITSFPPGTTAQEIFDVLLRHIDNSCNWYLAHGNFLDYVYSPYAHHTEFRPLQKDLEYVYSS